MPFWRICKRSMHGSNAAMPWGREARQLRLKEAKTDYIDTKRTTKHAVGLAKSEAEKGIHHSLPRWWWCFYIANNRPVCHWVRTAYAMALVSLHSLTKTGWKLGLSTMLGCSISSWVAKEWVPWSPCQCVCNPNPKDTQQDEIQQGFWPIWHHKCDAKSCLRKESNWQDNWQRLFSATSKLGGKLNPEGEALDSGNYHGFKLTQEECLSKLVRK